MITRTLGANGPAVSALGLGCMGMSDFYGPADETESVATIRAALDAGVTLLDTGDYYGMGHNELLLHEALRDRPRDEVVVSAKFGLMRGPDGAVVGNDLRPPRQRAPASLTPEPRRRRPSRRSPEAGGPRSSRPARCDAQPPKTGRGASECRERK